MTAIEFFVERQWEYFQVLPHFHELSPTQQGMFHDGAWKARGVEAFPGIFMPAEQGLPYDGIHLPTGSFADTKLASKFSRDRKHAYVYISQNEFFFAKEHDITYPVYWLCQTEEAILLGAISFSEAYATRGCMEVYQRGQKSYCPQMSAAVPPWSIDVLKLRPHWYDIMSYNSSSLPVTQGEI